MYITEEFDSMQDLFTQYKKYTSQQQIPFVGKTKFMSMCKTQNISIYSPKKDLCDRCVAYKNKQLSQEEYDNHIEYKNMARVSNITISTSSLTFSFKLNIFIFITVMLHNILYYVQNINIIII